MPRLAWLAVGGLLLVVSGASAADHRRPPFIAVKTQRGVFVTRDARSWRDVTPKRALLNVDDATFVDADHGWLATTDCAGANGLLERTADGGHTWNSRPFVHGSCAAGAGIGLDFLDRKHGWATHEEPTASFGDLYATSDGGTRWHLVRRLPDLGEVAFRTRRDGWLGGRSLYRTTNGGRTWRRLRLPLPPGKGDPELPASHFAPPTFYGPRAFAAAGTRRGNRLVISVYATPDLGSHWTRRLQFDVRRGTYVGSDVLLSAPANGVAWVSAPSPRPILYVTRDGGRHWAHDALRVPGAARLWNVAALDGDTAIVQTDVPGRSLTFVTHDGGRTWHQAPV